MPPGDRTKAEALSAVTLDSGVVEFKRLTSDVLAFELGAPHAGADSLDDQAALQFGDDGDDYHDGPAQRPAGIDIFPERDVLDVEVIQFVQGCEEVPHRAGTPV